MTKRDFYNAVINGTVNDEMIEFAKNAIVKLDTTNEKRKGYVSPKVAAEKAAKAENYAKIFAALTSEPQTASDLIAATGLEIKPQSVAVALKGYVADGTVVKEAVKVDKRNLTAYKLA